MWPAFVQEFELSSATLLEHHVYLFLSLLLCPLPFTTQTNLGLGCILQRPSLTLQENFACVLPHLLVDPDSLAPDNVGYGGSLIGTAVVVHLPVEPTKAFCVAFQPANDACMLDQLFKVSFNSLLDASLLVDSEELLLFQRIEARDLSLDNCGNVKNLGARRHCIVENCYLRRIEQPLQAFAFPVFCDQFLVDRSEEVTKAHLLYVFGF